MKAPFKVGSAILIATCALLGLTFLPTGCSRQGGSLAGTNEAVAVIHPTQWNSCRGVVRFTQVGNAVRVKARLEGLNPKSKHGFHIHQFGDDTLFDGKSAGGHYNVSGKPHGLPPSKNRHEGDLGNLTADEKGVAELEITVRNISVAGRKNPIIGRAVIVHKKEDDGGQPTGNAGARIGIGVIGIAKPAQ